MPKLLKWCITPLLWGCLDAPAPPEAPAAEVRVHIGDPDGHLVDSVKFSSYDSLCFQAMVSDSALAEQLTYRWIIDEDTFDSSAIFCPQIIKGSIGTAMILLEVEDQHGKIQRDSVLLLANTPPVFDPVRSSYIPAENALCQASTGEGLRFTWAAFDHDDFDTLTYLFRLGHNGIWTDSLESMSPNGFLWNGDLVPNRTYQWQVTVRDWVDDRDSTPVFHFRTRMAWDRPWAIAGTLRYPYPDFPQLRPRFRIIAQDSHGDTLHFPLDSTYGYQIQAGPQQADIMLFAWDSVSSRSSDTLYATPVAQGSFLLEDTLRFP